MAIFLRFFRSRCTNASLLRRPRWIPAFALIWEAPQLVQGQAGPASVVFSEMHIFGVLQFATAQVTPRRSSAS